MPQDLYPTLAFTFIWKESFLYFFLPGSAGSAALSPRQSNFFEVALIRYGGCKDQDMVDVKMDWSFL